MSRSNIVVLGAGVSGLTTALLLSRDTRHAITIVAKHMPGDWDIEYCSPWAGANYLPSGKRGTPMEALERATWPELARLAESCPEAGIHFQDAVIYGRRADAGTPVGDWMLELTGDDAWVRSVVPGYRALAAAELPAGVDRGARFGSVCINPTLYLSWLLGECLRRGTVARRAAVAHVADAARLHYSGRRADLVVNCTGLASLTLPGIEDRRLWPGRGQTVLVRNVPDSMTAISGADNGGSPHEVAYVMNRAGGGGCILGGCLQPGQWESQPDPDMTVRIMQRAVKLCPSLVPAGRGIEALSVIRAGVGLRPMRDGGVRLDAIAVADPTGCTVPVVNNYGHGGYGYQSSYGCAQKAAELVEQTLASRPKL